MRREYGEIHVPSGKHCRRVARRISEQGTGEARYSANFDPQSDTDVGHVLPDSEWESDFTVPKEEKSDSSDSE